MLLPKEAALVFLNYIKIKDSSLQKEESFCRVDWIRTSDPLHPMQVRYRAAPPPETMGAANVGFNGENGKRKYRLSPYSQEGKTKAIDLNVVGKIQPTEGHGEDTEGHRVYLRGPLWAKANKEI